MILYGKLFLLMGITWITEIISWAVGGPEYYWYFSDILNLLRAVFIFILFICKKSVYGSLKRKLLGKSKSRNKEGGSKSMSDALSVTTSLRESKGNTRSNSASKKEAESQKLVSWKQAAEENCKNGGLEESNM